MVVTRRPKTPARQLRVELEAQRSWPQRSRHDELKASGRCDDLRSRRFTLLSFQRPSPCEGRKKSLRLAPEASRSFGYLRRIRVRPKALQLSSYRDFPTPLVEQPTNGSSTEGGVKRPESA